MRTGKNLAQHIRAQMPGDFPMIRLFQQPASAVMSMPVDHPMTVNVSKLDRQTLLAHVVVRFNPRKNNRLNTAPGSWRHERSAALKKKDESDVVVDIESSYFTVYVNDEIFGLPVENTHTIFRITSVTPVPHGPADIAGLVNLRGKIVTAVSSAAAPEHSGRRQRAERAGHRYRAQGRELRPDRRRGRRRAVAGQSRWRSRSRRISIRSGHI